MKDLKEAYKTIEADHFAPKMEISFITGDRRETLRYEKVTWNIGGEEKCVCCLSPSFTSTANGNVVGRPVCREGSLVQKADSPGRNKGSVAGYEDVLFGGTDFYGKRRVKSPRCSAKAKIDIGCAESDPDGLLLLAR